MGLICSNSNLWIIGTNISCLFTGWVVSLTKVLAQELISNTDIKYFILNLGPSGEGSGEKEQRQQILQGRPVRSSDRLLHSSHRCLSWRQKTRNRHILPKQSCCPGTIGKTHISKLNWWSEIIGVCKHPSPCMWRHDVTLRYSVTLWRHKN